MNYAGTFGTEFSDDAPVSLTDHHIKMDSADAPAAPSPVAHDTILIPDAQFLFAGDYNRLGNDLILSKDGHEFVVPDYFRTEKRAFLASPDGANLSGDVIQALTGHVQYAQAGSAQSAPKDIGQVSKLIGSATVIRNGVLVELHNNDRVYKGDVVQAGANSSCTIVFMDGSVFGLSANARMVLNEMIYDQAGTSNSALLSLVRGTISFVAGETAKHGDMKVETPVATMGIRGTAVLVEIGFEIPSDGKGPPVNFQVLVEPDGTTGSYIVYSKSDPNMVIGTIDKAGQIYSVSGNGTFSNLPSPDMSQVAAAIIQQVFTQRFQGYVPDKLVPTPQGGGGGAGSTPATPPDPSIPKFPTAPGDGLVITPITVQISDGSGGTKTVTIPVGVGIANTPPAISVHDVVTDAQNFTFKIADRVTITDPDANNLFHDIPTPYVPGSATLISAVGPSGLPNTIHLNQLVTIDPQTGAVSYAHGAFAFLAQGEQVIITIEFDSKSGPDTVHQTLHFIIDGLNDKPTVSVDNVTTAAKNFTFNIADQVTIADPDIHDIAVRYIVGSAELISASGLQGRQLDHLITIDKQTGAVSYDHNAFGFLKPGEQAVVTIGFDSQSGPDTVHETIQLTIDGVNDAPVARNDAAKIAFNHTSTSKNLLTNDTDIDTAHNSLSVSHVAYATSTSTKFIVEGKYGELIVDKETGNYTYKLGVTHDQSVALANLHTGWHGTDTFYYTATDGSAESNVAKLTVSFDKPYDYNPPDAHSDHLIISAGAFKNGWYGSSSISFDNSALLRNDRDNDNDIYHNKLYVDDYYNGSSPHGNARSSFNGEDTVYTITNNKLPGTGQIFHDGFNYTAIDHLGSSSSPAHVDVTVVGADPSFYWWAPKTYTLNSTHDNDVLIGGDTSKENFVFKPGMGQDTIVGFQSGQDKIVLSGFNIHDIPSNPYAFNYWLDHHTSSTTVSGVTNTVIDLDSPFDWGPHEKITVVGVTPHQLNASDFIIHPGYA